MGASMRILILALCAVVSVTKTAVAADPDYQRAMQAACEKPEGAIFSEGVISNEKSALFIATRILNDIYGPQVLKNQTLVAKLHGDRYAIDGVVPKNYVGGNATMIICRSNAKVLYLSHSK